MRANTSRDRGAMSGFSWWPPNKGHVRQCSVSRPYECVARCAFTRVVGWGGDVHARGLDASEYRVAREVGQHAKARFKGSISHLEKPKVRILDYPTMGESDGASLRWMGDA